MSIVSRLRSNDPSLEKLVLNASDYREIVRSAALQIFRSNLRANSSVKELILNKGFIRMLSNSEFESILECVGEIQALEILEICYGKFSLTVLCESLRNAHKLRRLNCTDVSLIDGSNCDGLRNHRSLNTVAFMRMRYEQEHVQDGPPFLDNFLQTLTTCPLEQIQLNYDLAAPRVYPVPWSPQTIASLFAVPTVRRLLVNSNRRQRQFATTLVNAIEQANTERTLQVLDLSFSQLGDNDAAAIVEAATSHSSAQELALQDNGITSKGCRRIAAAVLRDPSVHDVKLNNNELIGDDGAAAFVPLLQSHPGLQHLSLAACGLSDRSLIPMANALTSNTSLRSLEISHNPQATQASYTAFTRALRSNRTLTGLLAMRLGMPPLATLETMQQILSLVRDNPVINCLHYSSFSDPESLRLADEITMYLDLNRLGRYRFIEDNETATDDERMNILQSATGSLDHIYLLIRGRPTICGRVTLSTGL